MEVKRSQGCIKIAPESLKNVAGFVKIVIGGIARLPPPPAS